MLISHFPIPSQVMLSPHRRRTKQRASPSNDRDAEDTACPAANPRPPGSRRAVIVTVAAIVALTAAACTAAYLLSEPRRGRVRLPHLVASRFDPDMARI